MEERPIRASRKSADQQRQDGVLSSFFLQPQIQFVKRRRRDYACHPGLSPASFINCPYIQAARTSMVVLLFLVYFFQILRPLLHMSFGQVAPPYAERDRRGDGC